MGKAVQVIVGVGAGLQGDQVFAVVLDGRYVSIFIGMVAWALYLLNEVKTRGKQIVARV